MIEFFQGNALDRIKAAIETGNEKEAWFIQDCLDRAAEDRWNEKHKKEEEIEND